MNRLLVRIAAAAALVVALSACSMFTPPETRLMFGMLPTNELGYEVDDSGGITIESRNFQFSSPAGMPATMVTGYRAVFRDQANALLGQTSTEPQSLNISVPAGFQCLNPDPVSGCTALSEGARPAPGVPATSAAISSQLLNAGIAQAHILAGFPTGWYADITFYGHNSLGQFEETYRVNIVAPN